jgi:hypothetical protein
MFKRTLIIIIVVAFLITGCGAKSAESPALGYRDEGSAPSGPLMEVQKAIDAESASVSNAGNYSSAQAADVERMVIKNADLSLYVDQPPEALERISKMAEEMGGFVVAANVYQTTLDSGAEVPHASVTIRVPAEKLNEALAQIETETQQPLISKTISSQDVTSEYTDLESRLKNLEAAEKQLQSIMEEATKTDDVLSVFNQLTQVREQIEVIKGQMQYYEQSAALSAISAELYASAAAQPVMIGGWQLPDTAKEAWRALQVALRFLAKAAIWTGVLILPVLFLVLLPPALIIWLIWRWKKNKKAKAKAVVAPES